MDQSKEGWLEYEYHEVATALVGNMAAHMPISSCLVGIPATAYLPPTYGTCGKTKKQMNIVPFINA